MICSLFVLVLFMIYISFFCLYFVYISFSLGGSLQFMHVGGAGCGDGGNSCVRDDCVRFR